MNRPWDLFKWDMWNPAIEPLPKEAKVFRKISICTTCMDRTLDLSKTLPQNIQDNIDYPNIEFVLVNYNTHDNMEEWVFKNLEKELSSGIVKYVKTTKPKFYSMSHSRNIGFKSASGDIVTNVDADNFTGKGFANHLNLLAEIRPNRAFFAKGKRMMHGRVGMYKNEFLEIGGYDEELQGYGYDDHSLMIRAMNYFNAKLMWWAGISEVDFTRRIKTSKGKVVENMENKKWRETEKINKEITHRKINAKEYVANVGKEWGKI